MIRRCFRVFFCTGSVTVSKYAPSLERNVYLIRPAQQKDVNFMFDLSWLPFVLQGGWGHFLFMLFTFIYVYWCPTQFPYQMMFVSSNRNTAGVTYGQELLTLPERRSSPVLVLSGVRVARSLVFCVIFCRWLFVLLSFFVWPMRCLSFDLRVLITKFRDSLLFLLSNFMYVL